MIESSEIGSIELGVFGSAIGDQRSAIGGASGNGLSGKIEDSGSLDVNVGEN